MADWKTDLRTLADKLRADQKNKKGFQSKFQHVVGYKEKLPLIHALTLDIIGCKIGS